MSTAIIDKGKGKRLATYSSSIESTPCCPTGNHTHQTRAYTQCGKMAFSSSSSVTEVTQPPKEAKDIVKDAIMTTLGKKEFMSTTALAEAVKKVGRHVLELPPSSVAFNSFCDDVVKTMRNSFQKVGRCRSNSTKRERLWRAFHKQSVEQLPSKWKKLYTSLNIEGMAEQLFDQTVNVVIYEQLMKEHFVLCTGRPSRNIGNRDQEVQLSKDEMNALRYASGYIVMKILKKYEKEHVRKKLGIKAEQFEMCLGNMAVAGDETDYTECTSEWFRRVDRGGLFPVNDETLTFFAAIEKVTRQHLPYQYTTETQKNVKESVIKKISEDCDVQFYWTLISQDIDDEEHAIELLIDIADMWITIRGFSLASTWLEEYKHSKKTKVSKSKGLRKELYRKVNPPAQNEGQQEEEEEVQQEEDLHKEQST